MLDALQNVLVYGGAFVLVLSLVVFVHEFGHFQAARWSGVAVDTFSIGFGKTLASWKDKQGVQWKIGALPLGGYVKFADDADASSARPLDAELTEEERAAARAKGFFHVQPLRIKAFVVAAGPLTNFLFSILIFAAVILAIGRDATDLGALPARVDTVVAGQPAAAAGFQPGDVVRSIDGQSITRFGELQEAIAGKPGQAITFSVVRGDSLLTLTATPGSREQLTSTGERVTRGMLGISTRSKRWASAPSRRGRSSPTRSVTSATSSQAKLRPNTWPGRSAFSTSRAKWPRAHGAQAERTGWAASSQRLP
jgi:regulator of sigma E protease